mmetsp:Transcript_38844/g.97864  ORF Transcript_38844/g.97864 Transcript_38844/m.97864 type:complete len:403 (-) Transcript_38844:530-1738(-)
MHVLVAACRQRRSVRSGGEACSVVVGGSRAATARLGGARRGGLRVAVAAAGARDALWCTGALLLLAQRRAVDLVAETAGLQLLLSRGMLGAAAVGARCTLGDERDHRAALLLLGRDRLLGQGATHREGARVSVHLALLQRLHAACGAGPHRVAVVGGEGTWHATGGAGALVLDHGAEGDLGGLLCLRVVDRDRDGVEGVLHGAQARADHPVVFHDLLQGESALGRDQDARDEVREQRGDEIGDGVRDRDHQLVGVLVGGAAEGQLAGDHGEEQHAERPHVHLGTDVGLTPPHLGRRVVDTPAKITLPMLRVVGAGESPVAHQHLLVLAAEVLDEDVLQLEVAMDKVVAMRTRHGAGHLQEEVAHLPLLQTTLLATQNVLEQVTAVRTLHRQIDVDLILKDRM